jgi:hypothetical protein
MLSASARKSELGRQLAVPPILSSWSIMKAWIGTADSVDGHSASPRLPAARRPLFDAHTRCDASF